ncbi:hypothetical protein [Methylovorus sp. MM2]|uniref:hypothetical protein n=1 Tax=Methylovorus sp. MM2 TaxID=1848038 RepID=UPI001042331D|nr:hypothetical protein [Methylovorus sp. MM2]
MTPRSALQILGLDYSPERRKWDSLTSDARRLWLKISGYSGYSRFSYLNWDSLPESMADKLRDTFPSLNVQA